MNNIRFISLTLLIFAAKVFCDSPSYSSFTQVRLDEDKVETEVFAVTLDQLANVYQPNSSPIIQKTKYDLMHRRAFLVVRIVNKFSFPVAGRIQIISKWNGGIFSVMDVHYLSEGMEKPDYFIVPERGIFSADRTTKPEFEVEWLELRRVQPRECKSKRQE